MTSSEFEVVSSQEIYKEVDEETREFIRNHMESTSEKPKVIPRYLYHASPTKNASSILNNGVKTHEVFGEIYLCEKERQVLKFIKRPCIVFRFSTADLNLDKLYLSKDHKKTRERDFEAYTYYENIEPNKIKSWQVFR